MIARRVVLAGACGLLSVAACASPPGPVASASTAAAWQGQRHCRFVAPSTLGTGRIEWVGPCVAGKADGLGMLKPRGPGAPDTAFYGRLRAGVPQSGIVEMAAGYKAGRFMGGDIVTGDDMDLRDAAFEEAAKAVRAVAASYRAKGNAASSRFYAAKGDRFIAQIE